MLTTGTVAPFLGSSCGAAGGPGRKAGAKPATLRRGTSHRIGD
jgi:hypothetical protein